MEGGRWRLAGRRPGEGREVILARVSLRIYLEIRGDTWKGEVGEPSSQLLLLLLLRLANLLLSTTLLLEKAPKITITVLLK